MRGLFLKLQVHREHPHFIKSEIIRKEGVMKFIEGC